MKKIYKNQLLNINSKEDVDKIIQDKIECGKTGGVPPKIPKEVHDLMKWNYEKGWIIDEFEFIDKTESEEKQEEAEKEEIEKLKSDNEYFLNVKIRPKRDMLMDGWVDKYQSKPLLWAELTTAMKSEIEALRLTLKEVPQDITSYMTDEEIDQYFDNLKPSYV